MTAASVQPSSQRAMPIMLPREHGAWAMLLIPFLSALLLARRITWEVAPAAVVVVGLFVIREPLVALWRQTLVWKQQRPEAEQARRSLAWWLSFISGGGLILLWRLPTPSLLAMGAMALLLTAVSVHLTVRNRQRSVLLQWASAAGLNASAFIAWLAVGAEWDSRIWLLWALQFTHSGAALFAVHARLEARIAWRSGTEASGIRMRAIAAAASLLLATAAAAAAGRLGLALALGFSTLARVADLAQLQRPASLQTPLRRIGLRELTFSLVFSLLLLAGLW